MAETIASLSRRAGMLAVVILALSMLSSCAHDAPVAGSSPIGRPGTAPPNLSVDGPRTPMRQPFTARSDYRITLLSASTEASASTPLELVDGSRAVEVTGHTAVEYVISGVVQNVGTHEAAWVAFGPLVTNGRYLLPNPSDQAAARAGDRKPGHIGDPVTAVIAQGHSRAFTLVYTVPGQLSGRPLLLWPRASSPPDFRAVFQLPDPQAPTG